ncbi:MAG: hypothetical protein FK734_01335 [Asgard group archaeon]|nr:hypothetical protein [Asgard group archaeon]
MTMKSMRRIMLYTVMLLVLVTVTFQKHQQDNSFVQKDELSQFDEMTTKGLDPIGNPVELNSVIYNYTEIGSYVDAGQAYDVVVKDNLAFIADGTNGLVIVNIANKSAITYVGKYIQGTTARALGVEVFDDYAFLCYGLNGFIVLDLSNLASPQKVSEIATEFTGYIVYQSRTHENYTYVAAGQFGMAVIDITDPENIVYVSKYTTGNSDIRDVDILWDDNYHHAYIADAKYGVKRLNIFDPSNVYLIGGFSTSGAYGVYVRSDYRCFVADYSGFYILSLYSYPNPTVTDSFSAGDHALKVFVEKQTAFVTYSGNKGMKIFNVSDVLDISYIGAYNDGGSGYGVYVKDDWAYLCDGASPDGLEVILIDSDSDGLYDGYEIYDTSTDYLNDDTDDDQLLDGDEFYGVYAPSNIYATNDYIKGCDPLDNDTDDDTLDDYYEIFTIGTNPLNNDSDADELLDNYELTNSTDPKNPDTDDDNILDGEEIILGDDGWITNPLSNDTDSDTMPDGYEVDSHLNPTVDDRYLDFDGDGILNIDEYKIYGTKPDLYDTDSDGLSDGEEVYGIFVGLDNPYHNGTGYIVTNAPKDPDLDNDQLEDGDEIFTYGTNPMDPDTDDDTILDGEEVLAGQDGYITNPLLADSDGDGLGDAWETKYHTDPNVADADDDPDNDGLTNMEEFTHLTDPQLSDTDGDGMNDGWEVDNSFNPLVRDGRFDADNDGLTNLQEFQEGTNPRNADTDGDGLDDYWEVNQGTNPIVADADADPDTDGLTNALEKTHGTNPLLADTDGDGLTDGQEVLTYNTNPLIADSDRDGVSDYQEILDGTDPNDPKSNKTLKNLRLYIAIGVSSAVGILIFVLVFFLVFWTTRPEQKMFKYLESQRKAGKESLSLKEVSVYLEKKLNRGDIKQIVNNLPSSKGYIILGSRIYLSSFELLTENVKEYEKKLEDSKDKRLSKAEISELKAKIQYDIRQSNSLGYTELSEQLTEIFEKFEKLV